MSTTRVALTESEIRAKAPQVYTQAPYGKVSTKYTFIPTFKIIEDMEKLGWYVSDALTMKSTNQLQHDFGKHMVKFYNPNIRIENEEGVVDAYPEILIVNNHRGWGRFKFEIGIFRLVCSNGLVIKSKDLGTFVMRHLGYSFEELQELVSQATAALPKVVDKINTFTGRQLTAAEQHTFATKALQARFGEEKVADNSELVEMLSVTRPEDAGNSLWAVFNRVQEKLINGGFIMTTADKKERKVRKITNMLKDLDLNQKLWELTDEFFPAKEVVEAV